MSNKIPVIIDCDPGLDDVIALLMAFANEKLDVKAVTVVAGNQTLEKVVDNTLRVLSYGNIDVPVGIGFESPMVRELVTAGEVHGENGIYGIKLPEPTIKPSEIHAIDLIAKVLRESEEKVTLIPIGPLTNIAMFLRRYPELKNKIERIALMGGAVYGGNCTPAAEFNIYVDPEAADVVFKSGVPIMMAGLDVTHKAIVRNEDIKTIEDIDNKIAKLVAMMLGGLSDFHSKEGLGGCYLHDPVPICYVANPEILKTKALHVDIELKGEFTAGSTVADVYDRLNKEKNVDVAFDINREAFVEEIIKAVRKY